VNETSTVASLKQLSRGELATEQAWQYGFTRPVDFTMTFAEMVVAIIRDRFHRDE
jgi:hypothetical protein